MGALSFLKIRIYEKKILRNTSSTNGQIILPVHQHPSQWTMCTVSLKMSRT